MPTVVSDAHKSALSKAKIALMSRRDSAFFTTLCFSMKHVWDDTIPTAYCDGREIHWNPVFFMDLLVDKEERVFLMCHETMHAAYLHMDPVRSRGKDPKRWNIACDHVINLQLVARGFKMPTRVPGHADPRFIGMSAEKVYQILDDEKSGGDPSMSDLRCEAKTEEEEKKLRRHIEDILVRAKIQSGVSKDKPGTIPGEIELVIDGLLNPKLPWYRIVQKWLQSFDKNDYSWRRPNRRHFPKFHLPSLWSEALMDLACFTDISGSVSDDDYKRYVTEICSLLRMMKPKKLSFGQFDTDIKSTHEIRSPQELMKVRFHGRGGTAIGPVLDWLNEHKPAAALIFSDGDFYFDNTYQTSVPVIWVVHDNPGFSPPFGKVVHFEM